MVRTVAFIFQFDRKQQLVILLLAAFIVFGCGYRYALFKERTATEKMPHLEIKEEISVKEIQVHVVGAVEKPGVYKLNQGARIIDAVSMAGLLDEAEQDALKLAAIVSDGQTVNVPYKLTDEEKNMAGQLAGSNAVRIDSANNLVNINSADMTQLCTLPGIGPGLAERILSYRETNGQFATVDDIKRVSGIGDKRFQDIKDRITVY
jgi:competence protein ComEA